MTELVEVSSITEKGVGSTTFTNYYVARESRCIAHEKHAKENG